jgi:hypothetical protein
VCIIITGLPAVAIAVPNDYLTTTITNVLLSNGAVGHFGVDTSMYEPSSNSSTNSTSSPTKAKNNADTVQLYNLTLAGSGKVIAINGPLAMLDDGRILVLPT